jgi:hypothetical protein
MKKELSVFSKEAVRQFIINELRQSVPKMEQAAPKEWDYRESTMEFYGKCIEAAVNAIRGVRE